MGKNLTIAGAITSVVGLIIGLFPLSYEGVKCGRAFFGTDDAAVAEFGATLSGSTIPMWDYQDGCEAVRRTLLLPAVIVLLVGLTLVVWGLVKNSKPTAVVGAPDQGETSVDGQLVALAQLHGSGALSDEEFAAAKRRVIEDQPAGEAPGGAV